MSPLLNPRHEAFAFALAYGSSPAEAYLQAGFNPKNRKARAQPPADDPVIVARVHYLHPEDPASQAVFPHRRHARPLPIGPRAQSPPGRPPPSGGGPARTRRSGPGSAVRPSRGP